MREKLFHPSVESFFPQVTDSISLPTPRLADYVDFRSLRNTFSAR
jgi:hypothetical protein